MAPLRIWKRYSGLRADFLGSVGGQFLSSPRWDKVGMEEEGGGGELDHLRTAL